MSTAVDSLMHPLEVISASLEMFGKQEQHCLTLEERRKIAKDRLRKTKSVYLLVACGVTGVARCSAYFLIRSILCISSPQKLFSQCKHLSYI